MLGSHPVLYCILFLSVAPFIGCDWRNSSVIFFHEDCECRTRIFPVFFKWKVNFSGLAKSKIAPVQVSLNADFTLLPKVIEVIENQNSVEVKCTG